MIAKGDLTAEGADDEFAAFEACYRTPFGDRLFAVRGNHDCLDGQTAYAADQWIEVDGLNIALLDTAVPATPMAPSVTSRSPGWTRWRGSRRTPWS